MARRRTGISEPDGFAQEKTTRRHSRMHRTNLANAIPADKHRQPAALL